MLMKLMLVLGESTGLVVGASESNRGTQVRSSAGSVCCFLEQETFTPQKVLVIPRNRWLRLNMTEKLFNGTLNKNQNKTKQNAGFKAFIKVLHLGQNKKLIVSQALPHLFQMPLICLFFRLE